jgi:hypothetical protein
MRCPSCGTENAEGMKFCGQCAAPLTEQPSASQPVAPLSYTPSRLTDMDESMAGIRRRILRTPGLPDEHRRPES